jgi:hypothetical protein
MVSESARMNSATEARFRVQAPNSAPRTSKVIALDAAGDAVVRRLAQSHWECAAFLTFEDVEARDSGGSPTVSQSALRDLAGRLTSVSDEVDTADLVVLVAGPGGHAHAASLVGEACSRRHVMTTGFVVGAGSAPESALSKTLAQVRPWSLMVVIADSDEYIDDMMTALRA